MVKKYSCKNHPYAILSSYLEKNKKNLIVTKILRNKHNYKGKRCLHSHCKTLLTEGKV